MADLLETLLQAQAHHARGGTEVVNIDVQGRWRLLLEHPLEQMLPALFGATPGVVRLRLEQGFEEVGHD